MSTQEKNVLTDDEYVEDADLLMAARDIFGDIVVKAEHKKYGFDYQDDKHLRFDSSDLRLTFKDGRVIELWNSEWGGIKRVDDLAFPPADQWTQEEQAKFTEENQPVIVFNRIGAFVNFAKGMEIKERNGTLDDSSRELLKKLEAVVDNHIQDVNVPSPVLIHKTNAVTRIICEEGIKEELKNGRVVEIGDGRELALDENGELAIVNTGMV